MFAIYNRLDADVKKKLRWNRLFRIRNRIEIYGTDGGLWA